MNTCTAAPTITPVGPMLHVTCPGCRLDYWEPRTDGDLR